MRLILLILFFPCLWQTGFCFQSANFELTVTDQNFSAISNITARLKKDSSVVKEIKISKAQTISFSNVIPAQYVLEIEVKGFKKYSENIKIDSGTTQKRIQLEIAEIVETVKIDRSNQDKTLDPREGAFTNFLTKAEIETLPDDPVLLKKALKQKFGEDAEFIVDGFSSKGLPHKSQIASIKISQSSFDAEYHKIGVAIVEITTKAFNKFFGFLSFDFNDARFNAREPFALIRFPEQNKSFDLFLIGPIRKNKTSFSINTLYSNSYKTSSIVAKLPGEELNNVLRSPQNQIYFNGKIKHNISQFQTLNLIYSYNKNDSKNLGVGGLDLPERAFNLNSHANLFRYSQSGNVWKKFYNEFFFQYGTEESNTASTNKTPVINVLDAFNKGGAGNDSNNQKRALSISDNLLWGIDNHALKIGGILEYEKNNIISSENENGTFTFSSTDDFLLNTPAVFTQRSGNREVRFSQIQLGTFIQDDFRVSKSLMLSLGMRYEWQNNLKDSNNFSPRLGFAWSPTKEGKTAFRGGVGLFYNWFEPQLLAAILSRDQKQPSETIIIDPGFPNPFSGGISQALKKNYWQRASDLKNPYIILGQFGVQQQLTKSTAFNVQYTFQKGIHQFRNRDINAPINFVRPNILFGSIVQFESSAFFVRNALKVSLNMSPIKRTYLSVDYRLAKSHSDANGYFGLPSDNYNLRLDRSISNNDQRHHVYMILGWTLTKNLRFSTIFQARSGMPFNITTGQDDNGDTFFNDRPFAFKRNSARGTWNKQLDASLSWKFSLGKGVKSLQVDANPDEAVSLSGKTLILEINADNVLNQTNYTNFVGVQISPFFRQPIAANNPRRINLGLKFSF